MEDERIEMQENEKKNQQAVSEPATSVIGAHDGGAADVALEAPEEIRKRAMQSNNSKLDGVSMFVIVGTACCLTLEIVLHAVRAFGLQGVLDIIARIFPSNHAYSVSHTELILDFVLFAVMALVLLIAKLESLSGRSPARKDASSGTQD